jgi:hypothetical protein
MKPLVPDDLRRNGQREQRAWLRAIACHALAKVQKSLPAQVLRAPWPNDRETELILKGPVAPTSTADYPPFDPMGVFRSLAPGSAAVRLFERSTRLYFAGIHSVKVPMVGGFPPSPIFVGEGAPALNVRWTSAATVVGPVRKILILSATTQELNRATPDTAVAIIGRVIAEGSNVAIDVAAFGTQPADAINPPGLLHGAVPVTAAAAGVDAMADDLAALVAAIGAARIDPNGVIFVAGPREAMLIKAKIGPHFDNDIYVTLGLPAKSVAAFAPNAIYYAYDGRPTIDTGEDVALHMEDATPSDIVSSSGTVAAPVKSFFQVDLISIRLRARAAWSVVPGGGQIVEGINW